MKSKEIEITIEERVYENKIIKKKITYPCFCKDEFGYLLGCIDGKTTICIGLNGTQSNPKDTHSIQTYNYVCPRFISPMSIPISDDEFYKALETVKNYIINVQYKMPVPQLAPKS